MKELSMKALEALLAKSESPISLKATEKLLSFGIPFNAPHGFKLRKLTSDQAQISVPFKRANKNHLGTVHACAIATLGEFPAGLLLIKRFSPAKYRVVMTRLEVDYHKHGVGELTGISQITDEQSSEIEAQLSAAGIGLIQMKTEISDKKGNVIASVATHWQLKAWKMVKTH